MRLALPPSFAGRHSTFHVSQLRPFVEASGTTEEQTLPPPPVLIDGDAKYYTVEAIRGKRRHRVGRSRRWIVQYLVKWAGYAESENTWEPASVLFQDVPELLRAYDAEHKHEQG